MVVLVVAAAAAVIVIVIVIEIVIVIVIIIIRVIVIVISKSLSGFEISKGCGMSSLPQRSTTFSAQCFALPSPTSKN